MRVGSLFTGAGGLDMAVGWLWPDGELAWFAETDEHAAAVFSSHQSDVPNLGDLRAVEWGEVGQVDVMVGGYPCQPWSTAGKRKGADDDRDGWPWFREAVGALGPRLVLLENVRGHAVPAGAGRTVGDLSGLGYDARWTTLRASDVGAPHRRERWFCVAHLHGEGLEGRDPGGVRERGRQRPAGAGGSSAGGTLPTPTAALADGVQELERRTIPERAAASMLATPQARDGKGVPGDGFNEWSLPRDVSTLPTPISEPNTGNGHARNLGGEVRTLPTPTGSDARGPGHHGDGGLDLRTTLASDRWGDYADAIARWEQIHGPAPEPADDKGRLSPTFVEWLMGWPADWTEGHSRSQRLKMLGNGVVPHQAVAAYRFLLGAHP